MHTLLIIGIFLSFFLQFLLLFKKGKAAADTVLAVWMFIFGIHLFGFYLYSLGYWQMYPHMMGVMLPLPLLHGPMLYLYVQYSLFPDQRFDRKVWIHFLPPVVLILVMTEFYFFFSADQKLMVDRGEVPRYNMLGNFILLSYIISGISYPVVCYRKLIRHKRWIRENFAYDDSINFNWLRYCVAGIGVIYLVVLVISILREVLEVELPVNPDMVIYFVIIMFIFMLGFFGIRQQGIFTDLQMAAVRVPGKEAREGESEGEETGYRRSGLKEDDARHYHEKLLQLMEDGKPYLQPKLNLNMLAGELGLTVNHLSQVINQYEGKNFYDFVNDYRVREFQHRAGDPANRHLSILAIALDSGFNSKSAFNSIFKKVTGKTPSEYLRT